MDFEDDDSGPSPSFDFDSHTHADYEEDEAPPARVLPFIAPIPEWDSPLKGFNDVQLMQLPDPKWLVEPFLPEGAFVLLYGPPGAAKSFLALEWAFGVCTGKTGMGLVKARGPVVYLAAEGVGGYKKRVIAWKKSREWEGLAGITFFKGAFNLMDPLAVNGLVKMIQALEAPPRLVVVDTLARCALGADENSAKDMGRIVAGVETLRDALKATVLVVHHAGKSGKDERGSSALRGAVDTVLSIERKGDQRTLCVEKQKDTEEAEPVRFALQQIETSEEDDSCVLDPVVEKGQVLAEGERGILAVLARLLEAQPEGVLNALWLSSVEVKRSMFYRQKGRLVSSGLVKTPFPDFPPADQPWIITPSGLAALGVKALPTVKLDDD